MNINTTKGLSSVEVTVVQMYMAILIPVMVRKTCKMNNLIQDKMRGVSIASSCLFICFLTLWSLISVCSYASKI